LRQREHRPLHDQESKAADRVPSASDTQPTAGVATVNRYDNPLDDAELALARAVYTAALHHDLSALLALCDACGTDRVQANNLTSLLSVPTAMDELTRVMQTHAEPTDGLTYPGFVFTGGPGSLTDLDRRDMAFLQISGGDTTAAEAYHGVQSTFEYSDPAEGIGLHWDGAFRRSSSARS